MLNITITIIPPVPIEQIEGYRPDRLFQRKGWSNIATANCDGHFDINNSRKRNLLNLDYFDRQK